MKGLAAGRIAVARVNDLQGVWNHEQLRSRGRFVEVATEFGPVELLAAPFDISGSDPATGFVPALGQFRPEVIESVIARGRTRKS